MPLVREVPVPAASKLHGALKAIHFCDAYQTPLSNPALTPQDAYEAVFGHPPRWVRILMAVRGVIAFVFGLKHETNGDSQRAPEGAPDTRYRIGQRAGLFSIQSIESDELIVGDNDKHLDFRISIYRSSANDVQTVTVSTAVEIHNLTGRLYMLLIKPFHRYITRSMVQGAVNAGRL